ncbi:MAG: tetratricopeptide repeat protein [Syntrophaceae bacterium]
MLMLRPGPAAAAQALQVGGTADKVRIVFNLKEPLTPDILSEERTLIVNFPDIIGTPATYRNFFLIKELTFDGSVARITMNAPYQYKTSVLNRPERFVIDISTDQAVSKPCPIISIDSTAHTAGISVSIHIASDVWPRILNAKSAGRVYLVFDQLVDCNDLKGRIENVPFVSYGGMMKMQGGSAVVLLISEAAKGLTIQERPKEREIVLDLSTTETIDMAKLLSMAREAFGRNDMAAVINLLKPHRTKLSPEAAVLLASAWWRISYPTDTALFRDAIQLMAQGLAGMTPGLERERSILAYADMLLATGALDEARKYIRFLKDSPSDDIAISARIKEMELLNKQALFEDAFAANKRLLITFPEGVIPADTKGAYYAALGDAYLGLNDYAKALDEYAKAVEGDPQIFQKDLNLYARLGDAAFKIGDLDKARTYMLLSINLGDPRAKTIQMLRLGDCLYKLGQMRQAVEVYSQVGNVPVQGENIVIAKLRKASILIDNDLKDDGKLANKTFYEVIGIYDSIEIKPNSPESALAPIVKIRRAQLYARHGDWDQAFAAFDQSWRETKPEDPLHKYAYSEAITSLASRLRLLASQGDLKSMLDIHAKYRTSFLADIRDPEVMLILAQAMVKEGQAANARALLVNCVQRPSDFREAALAALFGVDYTLGRMNDALRWNNLYLSEYPSGPAVSRIREGRGMVLYRLRYFKEAISYLEPAASIQDPRALPVLTTLVDSYHALGDRVGEDRSLDRIIALSGQLRSPTIAWAMYLRAGYLMSQDPLRARDLFETLQRTYPQSRYYWGANFNIARIMLRQGDTNAAVFLFNKIIQNSNDPLLIKAARSYLSEMDIKGTVAQFKREIIRDEPQALPAIEPVPATPPVPAAAPVVEKPDIPVPAAGMENTAPVPPKTRAPVRRVTRPAQPPRTQQLPVEPSTAVTPSPTGTSPQAPPVVTSPTATPTAVPEPSSPVKALTPTAVKPPAPIEPTVPAPPPAPAPAGITPEAGTPAAQADQPTVPAAEKTPAPVIPLSPPTDTP